MRIDLAPGAINDLMAVVEEYLDGLGILVNNAALEFAPAPITDIEEELYDTVMAVNAKSTFLTIRHAARTMREAGRIITLCVPAQPTPTCYAAPTPQPRSTRSRR